MELHSFWLVIQSVTATNFLSVISQKGTNEITCDYKYLTTSQLEKILNAEVHYVQKQQQLQQ